QLLRLLLRENRARERRLLPSAVIRRRDDGQCLTTNPRSASLVAEHRSPPPTARRRSRRSASVRNRARAADEEHARSVAERIVESDAEIRVDHNFIRQLSSHERLPELLPLSVASGTGDADAEDARHDVRHLA